MKRILVFLVSVLLLLTLTGFNTEENYEIEWLSLPDGICLTNDSDIVANMFICEDNTFIIAPNKDGKKGIVDISGEVAVPFEYDDICPAFYSDTDEEFRYAWLINNKGTCFEYSVFDALRGTIEKIDADYAEIYDGVCRIRRNGESESFISISGDCYLPVLPVEFNDIKIDDVLIGSDLIKVCKVDEKGNSKYGFINRFGKVVLPIEYDYVESNITEPYDYISVCKEDSSGNKKYGYIDKSGEIVVSIKFDNADSFKEGLAAVAELDGNGDSKWGFIDEEGKIVIPFQYNRIVSGFEDGHAIVQITDEEGYERNAVIDTKGKIVCRIPLEYNYHSVYGKLIEVMSGSGDDRKYGVIDFTEKVIVPTEYDSIEIDSPLDGLITVSILDEYGHYSETGCYNSKGDLVAPVEYDGIWPGPWDSDSYPDYFTAIHEDNNYNMKYTLIDRNEGPVLSKEYDYIKLFHEGFALVGERNSDGETKYKFIDRDENKVISTEYDSVRISAYDDEELFQDGIMPIGERNSNGDIKYKYIDISGNNVFSTEYDDARPFVDGLAVVGRKDENGEIKYGFINKKGELEIDFQYDDTDGFHSGTDFEGVSILPEQKLILCETALVFKSDKIRNICGLINKEGKEILPIEFNELGFIEVGRIGEKYNGYYLLYAKKGNEYGIIKSLGGSTKGREILENENTDNNLDMQTQETESEGIANDSDLQSKKYYSNNDSEEQLQKFDSNNKQSTALIASVIIIILLVIAVVILVRSKRGNSNVKPEMSSSEEAESEMPDNINSADDVVDNSSKFSYCPGCGRKLNGSDSYCPGCGRNLTD